MEINNFYFIFFTSLFFIIILFLFFIFFIKKHFFIRYLYLLDSLSKISQIVLCLFTIIGGVFFVSKTEYDFLKGKNKDLERSQLALIEQNKAIEEKNSFLNKQHEDFKDKNSFLSEQKRELECKNQKISANLLEKQDKLLQLETIQKKLKKDNDAQLKQIERAYVELRTLFIKNFIRSLKNFYKEEFFQVILLYEQFFIFQNSNIQSLEKISYKSDFDILSSFVSCFDQNNTFVLVFIEIMMRNIDKFNIQNFTYNGISIGELYALEKNNMLTRKEKKLHLEYITNFFKDFDLNKNLFWSQCENDLLHSSLTFDDMCELEKKTITKILNLSNEGN